MIPTVIQCDHCGSDIEVRTYRKFVICSYCNSRLPFEGFEYQNINWHSSMYESVKLWTDCPSCRSPNMYRGPERRAWKCPDCGYIWQEKERKHGVLWFCDECETLLSVQLGFSNKGKTWCCCECGHINDISKGNII